MKPLSVEALWSGPRELVIACESTSFKVFRGGQEMKDLNLLLKTTVLKVRNAIKEK